MTYMYYVDENGKVSMKKTSNTKKKKKQQEQVHYTVDDNGKVTMNNIEDIAPVKQTTSKEKNKKWYEGYLQLGDALKDGYQFGDLTKSFVASSADLSENLTAGIVGMGEKIVDAGAYVAGGVGGLFGADDFKKKTKKFIEKDLYDEKKVAEKLVSIGINPLNTAQPLIWADRILNDKKEDNSLLGDKTDSLVQSGGQLLATTGLQMVGVPWYLTTGVTSFGGQAETAFKEGATYKQAGGSALVSAGAEILFEKLGGGIKFGGKTLDDVLVRPLTEKISNKLLKTTVNLGLDATGEGMEEVFTSVANRLGTSLYKEESIDELLTSEEAMDEYIDSFVGGALMGGVAGTGRTITNKRTKSEQSLIDSLVEEQTAQKTKEKAIEDNVKKLIKEREEAQGGVLSEKNKQALRKTIMDKIDNGEIDISSSKLSNKELSDITKKIEQSLAEGTYELSKIEDILTSEQTKQIKELEEKLKNTKDESEISNIQNELSKLKNDKLSKLQSMTKNNRYLNNAIYEKQQSQKAYEYDESKVTDEYEKGTRESAKTHLNNSTQSKKLVDIMSKLAKDRQVNYRFTNQQELKEQGDLVENENLTTEEKTKINNLEKQLKDATTKEKKQYIQSQIDKIKYLDIGGFVRKNADGVETVIINAESSQSINSVVGHETKHLLEKNKDLNKEFDKLIFEFAKSKGEYDVIRNRIKRIYEGIKNVNIDSELSAELTGRYLFTDDKFIESLINDNKNPKKQTIVQKIKELIDDLVVRFKGTEQEKQLRQVQKKFKELYNQNEDSKVSSKENAYKQTTSKNNDTKYSFSGTRAKTANSSKLLIAEHMLDTGVDSETVRQETGWFKGYDGRMRFEIDDSQMKVYPNGDATFRKAHPEYVELEELKKKKDNSGITEEELNRLNKLDNIWGREANRWNELLRRGNLQLENILEHDKLYASYPELKDIDIVISSLEDGFRGQYNPSKNSITINERLLDGDIAEVKKTLIHEIQHAIQHLEGFSRGSSPEYWQDKIDDGEVIKTSEQKAELQKLKKEYADISKSEPEFVKEINELAESTPTVSRGAFDFDTFEQIEEDPIEWQIFDKKRESLEQKYGVEKVSKLMYLNYKIENAEAKGISANDAYRKTVGEIEARDTANRLSLNEEQRKATRPDIDKEDVVFSDNAKYSLSDSDGNSLSVDEKNEHIKVAQDYFGTTNNWDEVGYITLDGNKLDFSGRHEGGPGGYREVDHREIRDALGEDYGGEDFSGSLVQFMSEGNIRIMPESNCINLSVMPTKEQMEALDDFISRNKGEVTLDIDDLNGKTVFSMDYPSGTFSEKIFKDIEAHFKPKGDNYISPYSQFRYSLSNKKQDITPYGNYNVYGKDIALEQAPVEETTFINDETQTANNLLGIIANRDIKDHDVVVEDYQRVQLAQKIEAIVSESNGNNKKLFELLASETRKNEDNLKAIYDIEQKWIAENKKQSDKADIPDYIHNMVSTARFYRDMLDDATQSLAFKGKFDSNTLFKAILENEQVNQDYAPLTEEQANERDAEQSITSMPTEEFEKLVESYMDDAPAYMFDEDEIRAWAEEQARQNPQGATPKENTVIPESPLEERNIDEVGNRKTNAYMYENPEVKPFFQEEARVMLAELQNSVKGERGRKGSRYGLDENEIGASNEGWFGTKRETSEEIAYLLDEFKYSYKDIEKGLKAIIEDNGAENNAISKRIEFKLDERLRYGHDNFMGDDKAQPNQEYINLLNDKQVTEYSDESFNSWVGSLKDDIAPVEENVEQNLYSMEDTKNNEINELDTKVEETEKADEPELTVNESFDAKINNYKDAIKGYKDSRVEIENAFDEAIENKTKEYEALKRKDTKKATNLLMQIENYKLRKANNLSNIDSRIEKTQARIDNMIKNSETIKQGMYGKRRKALHIERMDEIKSQFLAKGFDFDKVLENAKNKSTFSSVDNTPQRFMEKTLGYKEGQVLADMTVNKVAQNESAGIRWVNENVSLLKQISKEYGIKPGSKESAGAQMYAEGFYVNENDKLVKYGEKELALDFEDAEVRANIKKLAKDPRIRSIYDETLDQINKSRIRNAYPEIPKRDNYFLHFIEMDDAFSRLGIPFNPNDIKAKDLPTDINGMTVDLKPGQPYFASAMHRKGHKTTYDLLGGVERYLNSAKNQIFHIDDIQTLRATRNYIADMFGQAKGLEDLDTMTETEASERIEQVFGSHLSNFAKFLHEEANVIAGKTALIDRGLEGIIGRRGISFLNTLNGQVGSNMVGFNVSSSLTNFISVMQSMAKSSKADTLKAFTQTVSNKIGSVFGRTDGFADNNPAIIRRKGIDTFARKPYEKISDSGYLFMSAIDDISTEIIVRTKFNELTRKGMSEEQAHIESDKWAHRILGDRSLGQQPLLYNSKMLGLLTKFQLEVRNQLDSQFYDTIQEAKVSTEEIDNEIQKNAVKAVKIGSTMLQLAVLQHVFGKAFESVAGYNPAFDIIEVLMTTLGYDDEEDSEDTPLDNVEQGFLALLEDLPYSSILTGGRIPISSALPIKELVTGEDSYGREKPRTETLKEVAPYYLMPTGYGQIKKTMQGLDMFSEEHPVSGSYSKNGDLRYPVEDTPQNRLQAGLFGQYANDNARYYFDNDIAPLNQKQIKEYKDVEMPIKDYWEYRDDMKGKKSIGDKADYISSLELPIDKKNILINNATTRKETIDMTDYEDYSSFNEFDFANKYPKKYKLLQDNNVSFEEYSKNEDTKAEYNWAFRNPKKYKMLQENNVSYKEYAKNEETKDAYDWAFRNPEKYTLSKAISSNLVTYRKYSKDIYNIRADKDKYGKSISGTKKKKVLKYINDLDADYGEKLILFKSVYDYDDTYNQEIIDYLNNREDITYDEMNTVLRQLGFTVTADGTIYWN